MSSEHSGDSSSPTTLKSLSVVIRPWVQITRVHKFAGTMVLFWPYAWSLTMAARTLNLGMLSFLSALFLGFVGSAVLHSAKYLSRSQLMYRQVLDVFGTISWTVNSIVKSRTKNRPIASGAISVPGASAFLLVHLAILFRLIWNLDRQTFQFGVVAIIVFPGIYPFMKRITNFPQAWLGLAMNVGAPMAWLSQGQGIPPVALTLYAGSWAWTMWYDTIYACQDKRDDVKAGVKSTALKFGCHIRPILSALAFALVLSLGFAGFLVNMTMIYYAISVGGGALYLSIEMFVVDLDSPRSCWNTFHRNAFNFGCLVWAGILMDYITLI